MERSLFDRMLGKSPQENLVTEVIAYLLESFMPFRCEFLGRLRIPDADGDWKVETQKRLDGPGKGWNGMIPDLVLKFQDREVLVEVKINAAPTRNGGFVQTKWYRDYLDEKCGPGQGWLVALTRWTPDRELLEPCHGALDFRDVARLLESSTNSCPDHPAKEVALQWRNYCKENLAMADVTREHLHALVEVTRVEKLVGELEQQLWDALQAAATHEQWRRKSPGRASSGAHDAGRALWAAPLQRLSAPSHGDTDYIQPACYYGPDDDGKAPSIRGMLVLRGDYLRRFSNHHVDVLSKPHAVLTDPPPTWTGGEQILQLDNVASEPDPARLLQEQLRDVLTRIATMP